MHRYLAVFPSHRPLHRLLSDTHTWRETRNQATVLSTTRPTDHRRELTHSPTHLPALRGVD